jgi:hypothetical protein
LNLRGIDDNYTDLDTRLLESDTAALTTLDYLLDSEAMLANIKKAAAKKEAAATRVESSGPKQAPQEAGAQSAAE